MNLSEVYKKSLQEKTCVELKTYHPDGDTYLGVILGNQKQIVILQSLNELKFDGITVLPKRFLKGYQQAANQKCVDSILKHNGESKKLIKKHWILGCKTLREILLQLKFKEIWPGVETLCHEGTESAFYLGPIVNTDNTCCEIASYDAAGQWGQSDKIVYSEIMRIDIGSSYCEHFNQYMKDVNPYPNE